MSTALDDLIPLAGAGPTQRPLLNARLLHDGGQGRVERSIGLMGTEVRILVLDEDVIAASTAIAAAFAEMARLEAMMTDWRADSQLMQVNREAASRAVPVDPELFAVIRDGLQAGRDTDGAFDISWRGAGQLWNFKAEPPVLPDADHIAAALHAVDYRAVSLDEERQRVRFRRPGVQIGLGGIAKGAIVDHAVRVLRERGCRRFVVNAGGDIYAKGRNGGGRLWWVAIRHPRDNNRNLAVLPVANMAVVTSGDYERYLVVDGRMYCHIIDPRSGWPAERCRSVTVMAATTSRADALATGIFVLGPERGLALVESLPHVEAMIVDADGTLHLSTGLRAMNQEDAPRGD